MGVLVEGRTVIAEAEQRRRQALDQGRDQALRAIIGNLASTLAEPEFTGDVETALVHYMGEEAFEDDVATERYTDLATRIEAQRGRSARIPVVFINQKHDVLGDPYGGYTAFLKVRGGGIHFKSTKTREEDVKMHAFTKTTAGVTHSSLGLLATTITFNGDVLKADKPLQVKPEVANEFVLSESHVADGIYGKGMPGDYAFSDYGTERFYGEPTILVGWGEIEEAFVGSLASRPASLSLQEALKMKAFFDDTGELETAMKQAPRLAAVIEAATAFQNSVGNLATDAR